MLKGTKGNLVSFIDGESFLAIVDGTREEVRRRVEQRTLCQVHGLLAAMCSLIVKVVLAHQELSTGAFAPFRFWYCGIVDGLRDGMRGCTMLMYGCVVFLVLNPIVCL